MTSRNCFEYCCGMEELGNFSGSYLETKDSIAQQLAAMEDDREQVAEGDYDSASGGLIATTTPTQKAAIRALKFHKFKEVFAFTNPGTGNKVTLWAKKLVR